MVNLLCLAAIGSLLLSLGCSQKGSTAGDATGGLGSTASAGNTGSAGDDGTIGGSTTGGSEGSTFRHPGLLLTLEDLERMRSQVALGAEPYLSGWNRLRGESRASADYQATPFAIVTRNSDGTGEGNTELRDDAARALFTAVAWFVSGDEAYARTATGILNAWSSTLTAIEGDTDRFLAAGLYGNLLANAGELLRHTYPGWSVTDAERFERMLTEIFYPLSHEFLETHAGSRVDHHYANWDAAQMVNIASIGVFSDQRALYEEAVDYFYEGPGNGNIMRAVFDGETGQLQESGRDQAHAQLGIGLLAALCETA